MTARRSRTLSTEELNAVAASSTDCFERVELDSDELPNTILQRLEESLRIAQKNRNSYSEEWITDVSVMVGNDNADITIELSFNMLCERAIPPGEPGSQSNLMPRITHIVPP